MVLRASIRLTASSSADETRVRLGEAVKQAIVHRAGLQMIRGRSNSKGVSLSRDGRRTAAMAVGDEPGNKVGLMKAHCRVSRCQIECMDGSVRRTSAVAARSRVGWRNEKERGSEVR